MHSAEKRVNWVSASEVGAYAYCGRLYWLTRVKNQKADAEAQPRLDAGHGHHEEHVKTVSRFSANRKHASEALWSSGIGSIITWLGIQLGLSTRGIWVDVGLAAIAMALAFTLRYTILARKNARAARIPDTVTVVEADTASKRGKTLRDPGRGLYGRPDYILEEDVGGAKKLVPVELKPTKKSTRLFESDELQLVLYLLILEHLEPMRVAGYGRVMYGAATFQVTLTEKLRARLMEVAEAVRAARRSNGVDRTHNITGRCLGCSVRHQCDQALQPTPRHRKQMPVIQGSQENQPTGERA